MNRLLGSTTYGQGMAQAVVGVLDLVTSVLAATVFAYHLSDGTEPIDAVSTAGPLILSVFLVYLYSQQNAIRVNRKL